MGSVVMAVLFAFCNFFFLTAEINRLAPSLFTIMGAKVEKIAMPRRQAEVIQCESVTIKSQLFSIK